MLKRNQMAKISNTSCKWGRRNITLNLRLVWSQFHLNDSTVVDRGMRWDERTPSSILLSNVNFHMLIIVSHQMTWNQTKSVTLRTLSQLKPHTRNALHYKSTNTFVNRHTRSIGTQGRPSQERYGLSKLQVQLSKTALKTKNNWQATWGHQRETQQAPTLNQIKSITWRRLSRDSAQVYPS